MPDYDKWTEKEQEAFAERIDYPVRKAAHATEYACFAVLPKLWAGRQKTDHCQFFVGGGLCGN